MPGRRASVSRVLPVLLLTAGLLLFAWVVKRAGWREVLSAARAADAGLVSVAIALLVASILIRALKWHVVMRSQKWVASYRTSLAVYGIGCSAGFLTPGRAGELSAPFALRAIAGVPLGRGTAMILADRILEAFVLLVAVSVSALRLSALSTGPMFSKAMAASGLAAAAMMLVLILVLFGAEPLSARLRAFAERRCGRTANVASRLARLIGDLGLAREILSGGRRFVALGLLTLVAWTCDFAFAYLMASAILPVRLTDTMSCQSLAIAAGLVAAVPSGLGVSTLSYTELMRLLGYPLDLITAAAAISGPLRLGLNLLVGLYGGRALVRLMRSREERPAGVSREVPEPEGHEA